ncbi:MAG: flavin reductase family protein [Thermoplasmata archaeon]
MAASPVDPAAFRRAMARWATGVCVVTGRAPEGADVGLTVNAFLSVSLAPPSVLVSIGDESNSADVIRQTGRFAVTVLASDQEAVSRRMATVVPPAAKFRDLPLRRSPHGLAWIEGGLAFLECAVAGAHRAHDHWLLEGIVEVAELGPDRLPLLFFRSRYGTAEPPDAVRLGPFPP